MINIVILGWYGTETLGDRAILAGLFRVFSKCFDAFQVSLGSIYPFLSERTLYEDDNFYKEISDGKLCGIDIFAYLNIIELRRNINSSDFVIFGGGPIMDIEYLYAIEYGFKYAKRKHIKTGILGCGLGPLTKKNIIHSMYNILSLSDVIILRDNVSLKYIDKRFDMTGIVISIDPAIFAAGYYSSLSDNYESCGYIAINFRDMGEVDGNNKKITSFLEDIISFELNRNNLEVRLIPNHTFVVGGDDRYYMNIIANKINDERVVVNNKPLSLKETLRTYRFAEYCYGMRFHSIIFQTVLNGRNVVMDYTDSERGKIVGLLKVLDIYDDFVRQNRYYRLSDHQLLVKTPDLSIPINISNEIIEKHMQIYIDIISHLWHGNNQL